MHLGKKKEVVVTRHHSVSLPDSVEVKGEGEKRERARWLLSTTAHLFLTILESLRVSLTFWIPDSQVPDNVGYREI